jgi:tRNA threonylcarbamoyladenosine biosynthesis protein TsaB
MTILCFDTSFGACSVALGMEQGTGTAVVHRFKLMDKGHSEALIPMIAEVLTDARRSLEQISSYAVTVGPGSFTGVRTGIAVVRGLALARPKPIFGATSLHVMAAQVRATVAHLPIAVAVSTRDGLVYFQTFDGPQPMPVIAPCVVTPAAAVAWIRHARHHLVGTGAADVYAAGQAACIDVDHNSTLLNIDARTLVKLAPNLPLLTPPRPLYLREADAKPPAGGFSPLTHTSA